MVTARPRMPADNPALYRDGGADSEAVAAMARYLRTVPHLRDMDPAEALRIPALRHHAAAHAYAGVNPMAHHQRRITAGGVEGFAQLLAGQGTVESAKVRAGEWLVSARLARAEGYRGGCLAYRLNMAATARRGAAERAMQK